MKIAAFSTGRQNGNTEVYIKEALMAAEAKGVEVELYRLRDYDLEACTACYTMCPPDPTKCPHKHDDAQFLIEAFLNADGYLIGSPVYSLTPNSLLFAFRDRVFGPKMDPAMTQLGHPEPPFIKGRFKARPGALISVGGAGTEHWTSLGLPGLYSTTFSAMTEVVDHLNVYGVADHDAATLNDEWLAKARKLGENLADAVLSGDTKWRGDKQGSCPFCHLDLIQMTPGTNEVTCAVCGIKGTVAVKDGVATFDWPDDEEHRKDNRLEMVGKLTHAKEVSSIRRATAPNLPRAKELMKKYTEYKACEVKSPSAEARKAQLLAQANANKMG